MATLWTFSLIATFCLLVCVQDLLYYCHRQTRKPTAQVSQPNANQKSDRKFKQFDIVVTEKLPMENIANESSVKPSSVMPEVIRTIQNTFLSTMRCIHRQASDRPRRELEDQLQKNGVNAQAHEPSTLPPLNIVRQNSASITNNPSSAPGGRPIKQEPYEPGEYSNNLSPSQTPTGLASAGFMSQLQEMQITSPGAFQNPQNPHQNSPTQQQHHSQMGGQPNQFMVGSLPASLAGQQYMNRAFFQQSPPLAAISSASLSEYSTPNTTWSPLQQARQMLMGGMPNGQYGDLTMEDLSSLQNRGPLLQGDPMIGSLAGAQMSPEIQWDIAGFSPDAATGGNVQQGGGNNGGHHAHGNNQNPVTSMDY
ncbi:Helix Loop Helix [Ditylenchus destructor]|uniref:Helix Loop Helix n=1 Tax=Ditylenchus destructor TaxID=166010 RepID=A0AAD4QY35_9BILA|nr:Helix Loop Helix [Ditylenchus destructor]